MTDTRKWSVLAAVLAVAVLAAGWFLLVSPKRGEAADLRGKAVTQQEANARLSQQISVLQAQQQDLPKQRARLAQVRTQIPDNPALPSLIRDLTAAGRKVGVSLDTMSPALPTAVVAAAPSGVAAPAPAGGADAAPAAAASTLYQVPLALNVSGSYFELEQFLNKLEGLKRSFLVTGFTVGAAATEDAAPDDLTIALTGRVFLSPPAAAATTTPVAPAATSGQ